jgi:hypothetical protein
LKQKLELLEMLPNDYEWMHLGVHMVLATLQMHRRSQQGTTMAT